jgi:hypothetical protein
LDKELFDNEDGEPLPQPRWPVWVYVVDGGLLRCLEPKTRKGLSVELLEMFGEQWLDVDCELQDDCLWTSADRPIELAVVDTPEGTTCTAATTTGLEKLLVSFASVFDEPRGVPHVRCDGGEHTIAVPPGTRPCTGRPFRLPPHRQEALGKILASYEQKGWIEPCLEGSPWSAPAFVVPKGGKTGEGVQDWRLVVDYRRLNAVTCPDHPLPNMETLLQRQAYFRLWSVLDLKHAFHQVPLTEASR